MNGVLVIDKPAGLTSHDVVNRVRRIYQQRSVGHLGTLDPSATGVLPLVLGNLTRLAQFYTSAEKTYEGVIRFGFATDTYDAAGTPAGPPQDIKVSLEEVRGLGARFQGVIEQMPPPFSAKKIQGVPAYRLARKHQDYMRSVAHEMGQQLGCGAHLSSLRRTKLGEFELSDAHTLEEADSAASKGLLEEILIHPRKLLPQLPTVTANEETAAHIRNGRAVNLPELSRARQVKVFCGQRELIAIATRVAGTLFHPEIVLAADSAKQLARNT
ncbi:MAG: tRNA pseudouridine(55) synthase [Acidobacteria bacterium]|nr:MAG: tRNA pseudouridine(55) synthase [Acidobacteriota bacterium]